MLIFLPHAGKVEIWMLNYSEHEMLYLKTKGSNGILKSMQKPAMPTSFIAFTALEDSSICSSKQETLIVSQKGMAQSSRLLFCQKEFDSIQLSCSLHNKVNVGVISLSQFHQYWERGISEDEIKKQLVCSRFVCFPLSSWIDFLLQGLGMTIKTERWEISREACRRTGRTSRVQCENEMSLSSEPVEMYLWQTMKLTFIIDNVSVYWRKLCRGEE